jgi:hypothetical protein
MTGFFPAVPPAERLTVLKRILEVELPAAQTEGVVKFLSRLPAEDSRVAVQAVLDVGWPPETVKDVLAGWLQKTSPDTAQDQLVEAIVPTALARGDSGAAKQTLLAILPIWEKKNTLFSPPKKQMVLVRAVIDHDVQHGSVDAATESLLQSAKPLLSQADLVALTERVAEYYLARDGPQAVAFLQKMKPLLPSSVSFSNRRVQDAYHGGLP